MRWRVLSLYWLLLLGTWPLLLDSRVASGQVATTKQDTATDSAPLRPFPVGPGQIDLDVSGTSLEVFSYKPACYQGERMILVLHGVLRNADEYRDHAQALGERFAALVDTGAERLVAANPGSHLFPTRDLPFGYGFGDLPAELSDEATLQRYLAAPLTLYLGTADNKPDQHFDLRAEAMKQGPGRWQRGRACFERAQRLAAEKGWTCHWRLVEAADVGHDHEQMFNHPQCGTALFGDAAPAITDRVLKRKFDSAP